MVHSSHMSEGGAQAKTHVNQIQNKSFALQQEAGTKYTIFAILLTQSELLVQK